jgi:hypothetical protein
MEQKETKRKDRLAWAGLALAFFTLIVTLYGVWTQLVAVSRQLDVQTKIGSAQYVLQLGEKIDQKPFDAVRGEIENNPHTYPLLKTIDQTEIENYLNQFESVGYLVRDGVITPQMAYDEFSYNAEKAYCNDDVRTVINRDRQTDSISSGTTAFYSGFEALAKSFLARDRRTCGILDGE